MQEERSLLLGRPGIDDLGPYRHRHGLVICPFIIMTNYDKKQLWALMEKLSQMIMFRILWTVDSAIMISQV
jgi:hypothetical protein